MKQKPRKRMSRRPDPVLFLLTCFWLLVLGGGWWIADHWIKSQANPNLQPMVTAAGEVVLARNREGHYVAGGEINGYPVVFMVDTGATDVTLSSRLARKLDLDKGEKILIKTANGAMIGFVTRLETVRLGSIDMHNVKAIFSEQMMDNIILLGMSFLNHLEFTQREHRLFLRVPQEDAIRLKK